MSEHPFVQIFTDGACKGNPGPGGWACLLRFHAQNIDKELSGGLPLTTNNQMELQAVISGLASIKQRCRVEVITDSTYVAKGAREWMPNWKKNGWKRRVKNKWEPLKNMEYWKQLDTLLQTHAVEFTMVKGHSGHPENERCDELAVEVALSFQNSSK